MFDLETLRIIWWILMGVLIMGFAVTDGFDLGIAALLPLVTRNELERSIVLRTIGPVWEGNQVWIILGAGAIFAAWPFVYAVAFSGAYLAILLLLLTMGISRPVSFKYRSKLPNLYWRRCWDHLVFIGGFVPALLCGILIGNVLLGLPFSLDQELRMGYPGGFLDLFHPFAIWCGLTSLLMLTMHGGCYLAIKTEGVIRSRAQTYARISALLMIIFFALGGVWVAYQVSGYQVLSPVDPFGFSNPLHKQVGTQIGAWLNNYSRYPLTKLVPAIGLASALLMILTSFKSMRLAFLFSSISIVSVIATVGVSMFPFILPSSIQANSSLLVWDASSNELTLLIMLIASIIFLPLIIFYTSWVYKVLRGKITEHVIQQEDHGY